MRLRCEEILKATDGVLLSGSIDAEITNISTDSRNIEKGDLFIPLAGEHFDGHDYIDAVFKSGAAAVLTHKEIMPADDRIIIKVTDTLRALGGIARYYRLKFAIPFIGITGSVGKTSTKDMVASVIGQKFNVLKNEGNFNNEIGLPLTIFKLDSFHQAAVIEMGMSGFDEISRLTNMTMPDIAIITNIGMSHIEKLGSRQNILKAKMEIFEGLSDNGLVVLNGDDKLLYGLKDLLKYRIKFYGMDEGMDYQAFNIRTAGEAGTYFEVAVGNNSCQVFIPVPGVHNIYNALAAIAVGIELEIPVDSIIKGIAEYTPGKMRLNIITLEGIKIINDAYNASPQSMEAAINVMKEIGGKYRKIAVLGDMLEMGDWAFEAHMGVGRYAVMNNVDIMITVGKNGANIARGALEAGISPQNVHSFEKNSEVNQFLNDLVKPGDLILVKGSRGMKMEEIVGHLKQLTNIG